MRATLKTSVALTLVAAIFSAGLAASTAPASAWPYKLIPPIPFKPIPFPKPGPGPFPHHHFHPGFGPWFAAGMIGAAAAASASAEDPCVQYRPVYDASGAYLGRTAVNVCE